MFWFSQYDEDEIIYVDIEHRLVSNGVRRGRALWRERKFRSWDDFSYEFGRLNQ